MAVRKKQLSRARYIPIGTQLRTIFFSNYLSMMLAPCIPAGFVVYYVRSNPITAFCINFAAIAPSAAVLSVATNELKIRSGEKLSALLNHTLGNAVQLILSILLLASRQIYVLKLSLLGTILSSLLLTTGLSFLLGGWKRTEQHFNVSLAQSICTLLLLAVSSLTIPTVLKITISESQNLYSFEQPLQEILAESRGISILIVCTYALWVFFTYSTHKSIFSMPITKGQERSSSEIGKEAIRRVALNGAITAVASDSGINPAHLHRDGRGKGKELELEECSLSLAGAMIALVTSVVLVGFNTQFATDSIQAMLQRTNVSQYFLSVIVLPLLSVDPLAIKMALRDRMDMSISLTLEKCMQTCLLVIPLTVLLAWCMGVSEMDLYLNTMILATLFLSVFTVSFAVRGGKSNWFTGALFIQLFIIIALAAFYTPSSSSSY